MKSIKLRLLIGLLVLVGLPLTVIGQAFSFADPAFMAQASQSGCALINSWAAQVVVNGGASPSAGTKTALCTFATGLITDSLDTKQIAWNALVRDNLIACFTPQLAGPGGAGGGFTLWVNASGNFVIGDLTINGLAGDGLTKTLDTGLSPSVIYPSINDNGITIYAYSNPNSTSCDVGVGNVAQMSLQMYLGTTYWDSANGVAGQGRISAANSGFVGYVSGNRTSSGSTAIYEANSGTAHNTLVSAATSGGTLPTSTFFVYSFSTAGVASSYSNQRLSFVSFHRGYTSAESAKFYTRIQQLETDLGGGFQ